jgi:hypothetical protein
MTYLFLACFLLLLGPFFYRISARVSHRMHRIFIGILALGVFYFALIHLLPKILAHDPRKAIPSLVAGFVFVVVTTVVCGV